ncbi:MAG: DUF4215 domain-containing protein [Sandaracinaceae bacterium]|nr:DUF4215 domain-containing protein [Sandaracinaceae bacterium]
MCDDGNTTPGDGCDAMCVREGYCGDGTTGGTEVCDDGNNRSGDGCRSDCMSDETCGNGIVDFAAGEICDGTPMCDPTTCAAVTGCGDGTVEAPEVCDDSNMLAFDGCGRRVPRGDRDGDRLAQARRARRGLRSQRRRHRRQRLRARARDPRLRPRAADRDGHLER